MLQCLGIMTGTSCDGADMALLALSTKGSEKLVGTRAFAMPPSLRTRLRRAQTGALNIPDTALLTRDYSRWLAKVTKQFIATQPNVDCEHLLICIHGQTLWHEPKHGFSVQIVDASIVACETGCTIAYGFRQSDLALGGQGAPLVPLYHALLAQSANLFGQSNTIAIHNIGGISNLTAISKASAVELLAFDTGPGNALIDIAVEKASKGKQHFDRNGHLAARSLHDVCWETIERIALQTNYLSKKPPKSTGRELFNENFLSKFRCKIKLLPAYATAFTAYSMAKAYAELVIPALPELSKIYFCGGGAKNIALTRLFSQCLENFFDTSGIAIEALPESIAPPDYIEAMAFARLGFESFRGNNISNAQVTGSKINARGSSLFIGANFESLARQIFGTL